MRLVQEHRGEYPSLWVAVESVAPKIGWRDRQRWQSYMAHIVTPETEFSCHYFFATTRNYRVNDKEMNEAIAKWQSIGFGEQGRQMLEAIQREMNTSDLMSFKSVLLPLDCHADTPGFVTASGGRTKSFTWETSKACASRNDNSPAPSNSWRYAALSRTARNTRNCFG